MSAAPPTEKPRRSSAPKKTKKAKKTAPPPPQSSDEDYSDADAGQQQPGQQLQRASNGELLPVGGVTDTATGLADSAGQTLSNVAGSALGDNKKGDEKSDTLRLRLDLNLDVEITLKARIHGDLELALLN